MPYCIGLTGGIGSGKSSAAKIFQEFGAAVIDTDEISHELTRTGGAALAMIREQFGANYLAADGSMDRAAMRRLIFEDTAAKKKLEAILHPMIRSTVRTRIARTRAPYVLVAVPLLLETGAYKDFISRVLVVDCNEALQVERTMRRSKLTADEVRAIMAAQLPRQERLVRADDVLRNDSDMAALRGQIAALHARYLALAGAA
jgi:dephospho-CoA kinase